MRRSILGAVATSAVALVLTASSVLAAKPHFVPSSFTGTFDAFGNAYLSFQVAGLGNGGSGRIVAKGWYKINCEDTANPGTIVQGKWTKRIVEHDIYADQFGNYIPDPAEQLNTGACKGNGRYTYDSTDWACVGLELYSLTGRQPYDSYVYADISPSATTTYTSRCPQP